MMKAAKTVLLKLKLLGISKCEMFWFEIMCEMNCTDGK